MSNYDGRNQHVYQNIPVPVGNPGEKLPTSGGRIAGNTAIVWRRHPSSHLKTCHPKGPPFIACPTSHRSVAGQVRDLQKAEACQTARASTPALRILSKLEYVVRARPATALVPRHGQASLSDVWCAETTSGRRMRD
ncbi:MAG: hypothetical protein JO270_26745 [Acidobacteriaceae bacterium]|nr:hypothetical protein [Acidobacteriaceae bacterium]